MNESLLKLFKGYYGKKDNSINQYALKYGILISDNIDKSIIDEAIKQYGKDGFKLNQTFHKDLEIVKNAPIEDLISQQIIHYITTYGFEELGIFNNDAVYIPREKLEVPELEENIELICINALSRDEIISKLDSLIYSGIALSRDTIYDIMILSDFIDKNKFDEIKNRELQLGLYDKYNVVPKDAETFFRYLIFKLTSETLKIQNNQLIYLLNNSDRKLALDLINNYIQNTPKGWIKLAAIFLRNKKLFLALKTKNGSSKELNSIINKLRKLASKGFHKPMDNNILDCLTNANLIINEPLEDKLNNITIFREIRILNGLKYRIEGSNDILYRIRNGKSFSNELKEISDEQKTILKNRYDIVYKHVIKRLSNIVKDKTIYIPNNIVYKAPTSEKQFNGNFPNGSYIEIPRNGDILYGIHWNNLKVEKPIRTFYGENLPNNEERVDLDLHQMNSNVIFGWDSSYRSDNRDVLFSGDVTNAPLPNGATEIFYVSKNCSESAFAITLNIYTDNSKDVPFEFFIANADEPVKRKNYIVDPNNILEKINMSINNENRQKVLGLIKIDDNIRFYFNDFSNGKNCTTKIDDNTKRTFNYLKSYNDIQLNLNDLLKDAGAFIVNKKFIRNIIFDEEGRFVKEEQVPVDVDLSLNSITKESIIKLFIEE